MIRPRFKKIIAVSRIVQKCIWYVIIIQNTRFTLHKNIPYKNTKIKKIKNMTVNLVTCLLLKIKNKL